MTVSAPTPTLNGPFYGLCYLSLAWLAYAPEVSGIIDAVEDMPVPDGVSGTWSCPWGPVSDAANPNNLSGANLCYVAVLSDANKAPLFAVVVLRGTDLALSVNMNAQQVMQDLDVAVEVDWSFPSNRSATGAKIALGTSTALQRITAQAYDSQTLGDFISTFVQTTGAPVVVTGHSLGGCLTQVMTVYLAGVLSQNANITSYAVLGNPFAPTTAGNPAFVALYNDAACAPGDTPAYPLGVNMWVNTNDVVPYAWADLGGIKNLWGAAVPTPNDCVDAFIALTAATSYQQPGYNVIPAFTTPVATMIYDKASNTDQPATWQTELVYQHYPDTGYWPYLSANAAALGIGMIAPPTPLPSAQA